MEGNNSYSKLQSVYNEDRYGDRPAGRRLRVEGTKRTEEEFKQMLRLADAENNELKTSLRYVEIQLAKTRENYKQTCNKLEDAQEEIQKCHEQVNRQANLNHAQAQQIEEMGKKMDEIVASQKEVQEKSRFKVETYQNEIDIREEEINRLKRAALQKDEDYAELAHRMETMQDRMADIEEELELKSGENNRLRNQVAQMEKTVQDLYGSRKTEGSLSVEIDNLKADNEKLLTLLRGTNEYSGMNDNQIMKSAASGGLNKSFNSNNNKTRQKSSTRLGKSFDSFSSEWIPNEAVRAIQRIKQQFNSQMTETCISQILYELNCIWRDLMRKEGDALKKKFNAQVQDLRRQLVTKRAFDEEDAHKEISRLKKELRFATKVASNKQAAQPQQFATQKENQAGFITEGGKQQQFQTQQMNGGHKQNFSQPFLEDLSNRDQNMMGGRNMFNVGGESVNQSISEGPNNWLGDLH